MRDFGFCLYRLTVHKICAGLLRYQKLPNLLVSECSSSFDDQVAFEDHRQNIKYQTVPLADTCSANNLKEYMTQIVAQCLSEFRHWSEQTVVLSEASYASCRCDFDVTTSFRHRAWLLWMRTLEYHVINVMVLRLITLTHVDQSLKLFLNLHGTPSTRDLHVRDLTELICTLIPIPANVSPLISKLTTLIPSTPLHLHSVFDTYRRKVASCIQQVNVSTLTSLSNVFWVFKTCLTSFNIEQYREEFPILNWASRSNKPPIRRLTASNAALMSDMQRTSVHVHQKMRRHILSTVIRNVSAVFNISYESCVAPCCYPMSGTHASPRLRQLRIQTSCKVFQELVTLVGIQSLSKKIR